MYWCFLTLKIQTQVLVYVHTKKINESFYKLANVLSDTAANCCLWICYKSSWPGQIGIVLFIILIKIISHNISKARDIHKNSKMSKIGYFHLDWLLRNIVTLIPREERNKETYGTGTQILIRSCLYLHT